MQNSLDLCFLTVTRVSGLSVNSLKIRKVHPLHLKYVRYCKQRTKYAVFKRSLDFLNSSSFEVTPPMSGMKNKDLKMGLIWDL